jgi:hypothetical protein
MTDASPAPARDPLATVVGIAAIVAPLLHSVTDLMEWRQHGFTQAQLLLNYFAFLPMPWLLLGICATVRPRPGWSGVTGALLYGAAFSYFEFTTIFALVEAVPDYETLWNRLGTAYTIHGGLMVLGGLLFAHAAWKSAALPRLAVLAFATGIAANLLLAVLPAPDILQTLGSAIRNGGLIGMGIAILRISRRTTAWPR